MDAIYCAGEQGRVVLDVITRTAEREIVFLDDDTDRHGEVIDGAEVVGDLEDIAETIPEMNFIIAFGDSRGVRLEIADKIKRKGGRFFKVIDHSTIVSDSADIGNGVFVNSQSYIGPEAQIANQCLIDSCVNISHDVTIKRGATITPNATLAGGVTVGQDAYIGPGATVVENATIGDRCLIAAGAVVTKDVQAGETVAGVPAEPID